MLNAGDSGYTPAAVNLTKIAATLKPDVFFMGGDIAYDDNMPACAYTWDYFLGMYGRLTATLGYLMPIVATVGNHDVGLNELPGINITINNYGPAYFLYFPQHYDRNLDNHIVKRVPPLAHRRTILSYNFANVHYLVLDSGYLHHFEGYFFINLVIKRVSCCKNGNRIETKLNLLTTTYQYTLCAKPLTKILPVISMLSSTGYLTSISTKSWQFLRITCTLLSELNHS